MPGDKKSLFDGLSAGQKLSLVTKSYKEGREAAKTKREQLIEAEKARKAAEQDSQEGGLVRHPHKDRPEGMSAIEYQMMLDGAGPVKPGRKK